MVKKEIDLWSNGKFLYLMVKIIYDLMVKMELIVPPAFSFRFKAAHRDHIT